MAATPPEQDVQAPPVRAGELKVVAAVAATGMSPCLQAKHREHAPTAAAPEHALSTDIQLRCVLCGYGPSSRLSFSWAAALRLLEVNTA